ncbi:unnamed protein product [Parnassius apollo]|uniref:(apollo) hypothetical protein n=1 Tax=Parnassius apollo TaxID=110799 RepID=A0A8S3Y535_PARAO|nr:unnamed protein product [Parnassius apollo]
MAPRARPAAAARNHARAVYVQCTHLVRLAVRVEVGRGQHGAAGGRGRGQQQQLTLAHAQCTCSVRTWSVSPYESR